MDFQNWMDLITAILTVFAGVITYGAHKLFTAKTKNANLNSFNKWADQAVSYVENKYADNATKKSEAVSYLTKILKQNKLLSKFTDEEIDGAIEVAVSLLPHSVKVVNSVSSPVPTDMSSVTTSDQYLTLSGNKVTLNAPVAVVDSESQSTAPIDSTSTSDSSSLSSGEDGPYVAK